MARHSKNSSRKPGGGWARGWPHEESIRWRNRDKCRHYLRMLLEQTGGGELLQHKPNQLWLQVAQRCSSPSGLQSGHQDPMHPHGALLSKSSLPARGHQC